MVGCWSIFWALTSPVLKPMAVTAKRNALLNLLLDSAPGVTMVHHAGDVIVFVSNVVELKDTMIIQPTLLALQSLLVLQKLLSILIDTFFSSAPGHV